MLLLIDIGNSRFKWQAKQGGLQGAMFHAEQELGAYLSEYWSKLDNVTACWGCSVVNSRARDKLDKWCNHSWGFTVNWVESSAQLLGVQNLYAEPETLGCDRWVALIAARSKYPDQAVCIIDAGTAITVDALSHTGKFLGGTIIPGNALLRQALGHNTAQVPAVEENQNAQLDVQARTTEQAVNTGVELLLQGGVSRIIQEHLTKYQRKMKIVVTGGDAHSLKLPYAGIINEPNLVFDGLKLIAKRAK